MKSAIMALIMISAAVGNEFTCMISPDQPIDQNIESCKLDILRHECEKIGINVSSNTTTENYMLKTDRVNSRSLCNNMKFTVTNAELNQKNDKIHVIYVMEGLSQANENITYKQWTDLGAIQSKTTANIEATQRPDSSTIINIGANLQIDSREINEKAKAAKKTVMQAISTILND